MPIRPRRSSVQMDKITKKNSFIYTPFSWTHIQVRPEGQIFTLDAFHEADAHKGLVRGQTTQNQISGRK